MMSQFSTILKYIYLSTQSSAKLSEGTASHSLGQFLSHLFIFCILISHNIKKRSQDGGKEIRAGFFFNFFKATITYTLFLILFVNLLISDSEGSGPFVQAEFRVKVPSCPLSSGLMEAYYVNLKFENLNAK